MTLLFLCILLDDLYVSLLTIGVCGFITVRLGGLPLTAYLRLLRVPIAFLVMGSFVIALETADPGGGIRLLDLYFFELYTTREGLLRVLHLWGKAFGGLSAMYMLSLSTPSSEIFSALRRWKVPPLIIELMNMIYRFIFVIMDTFLRMKASAQSRLGYCDYRTSLHTFGNIASNLFVVSMKKASLYYDAMESRCYDGELRFLEEEKPVTREQIACMAGSLLLIAAAWLLGR